MSPSNPHDRSSDDADRSRSLKRYHFEFVAFLAAQPERSAPRALLAERFGLAERTVRRAIDDYEVFRGILDDLSPPLPFRLPRLRVVYGKPDRRARVVLEPMPTTSSPG